MEQGVWDVIHKPLEMQKILSLVEKVKPCGVLIADDDPDFLKGIRSLLEKEGYAVYVARDGEEVLKQLETERVDVLILDLRMPVLNGLETYMKMRESGNCVPTIILTAYRSEESEMVSILESMCVYGILNKPFDPKALFSAIEEICEINGGGKGSDRKEV
jgi:DNA-binding response OmpR family regulator